MIVSDLLPGHRVPLPFGDVTATFVARTVHPLWPSLCLVVWRLSDGTWSHDALDARQDVGEPILSSGQQRIEAVRAALVGGRP